VDQDRTEDTAKPVTIAYIAESAGVSLGTFYQYFRDRADVMATLVGEFVLVELGRSEGLWDATRGRLGLRRVISSFVRRYAESAGIQRAWEQASQHDADLATLRRDLTRAYVVAVERELRRAQQLGIVRPELDPAQAAISLNAMVDRFCYLSFLSGLGTDPSDVEGAIDELTRLWADGIGLIEPGAALTDRPTP
jgi:AcrR family transcriptional regulator